MKISTEINSAAKIIGEEKAIELYGKAGFDAWDFSMFNMCKFDREKRVGEPSSHPLGGADYLKFARKYLNVKKLCKIAAKSLGRKLHIKLAAAGD